MFSNKATQIDEIFTGDLTLCSRGQIVSEDFFNFGGFLRKHELYHISKNWRPILLCSYFWTFAQCDSQGCAALMHCVQRTKKERVESYKIFVSIVCQKRAS